MALDNKAVDREHLFGGILRIYLYYRFFLALVLFGASVFDIGSNVLGQRAPEIYLSTTIIYLVLTTLTMGFYQLQRHQLSRRQLLINLFADLVAQTVLMSCSGGLSSGLGYLMLITVTMGAIFLTGQLAVLIPAIASICIIAEAIVGSYVFDLDVINIFPAGVLGVLLFATALVFLKLSDALVETQRSLKTETDFSAELQALNSLVIDRMRTGVIVVDGRAIVQQINRAARELLGRIERDNILNIGDSINSETGLLDRLKQWRIWPSRKTAPFIPLFGTSELQASFANLETGESERVIVFLEDFRTQAHQAQQLKLASLGRLTGSIAHEIRNPLGAISHASELLRETPHEEATTERLTQIINTQVKRVNQIVENVLQLSRKQNHNPQMISLVDWLKEFIGEYKLGNRENPIIELLVFGAGAEQVTFDPSHLQQVLTNLLDNAIRYSKMESGESWAQLAVQTQEVTEVVSLDVRDKGPGVPPEHQNQLFEPFFSTSSGGSGLGLYIARELCTINFATLKYQIVESPENGFFRLAFVHPNKILNFSEDNNDRQ